MIDREDLNHQAEALSELLHAKLGVRGKTLETRLRHAGRLLPARIQKAGHVITDAQRDLAHPKLTLMRDPETVQAAFAEVTEHLHSIDPAERRKTTLLSLAGGLVFNLLVIGALVLALLLWRDLI